MHIHRRPRSAESDPRTAFGALEDAPEGASTTPTVAAWLHPDRAPAAPGVQLEQLERFKGLMAEQGWPVHVARMLFDRLYAFDRIVLAHTSADGPLRALALDLFRLYQQRGAPH